MVTIDPAQRTRRISDRLVAPIVHTLALVRRTSEDEAVASLGMRLTSTPTTHVEIRLSRSQIDPVSQAEYATDEWKKSGRGAPLATPGRFTNLTPSG